MNNSGTEIIRNATPDVPGEEVLHKYIGSASLHADYMVEIGRGNVPGVNMDVVSGKHEGNVETTKLGDLSLIPNIVSLPVPGGIQMELVSSSTNDTIAGSGIQKVEVHYLDTSYDTQEETVEMNGQTPVNTVATNIQEIQWIHASQVGSGGVAAGNISLRDTAGSVVFEYISAGGNQSLSARCTIPNGKVGILANWHVSGLKKRIDFLIRAECTRKDRTLNKGVFLFQDSEVCESSNSGLLDGEGLRFPAQCTIKISVQADSVGGEAAGSFKLLTFDV